MSVGALGYLGIGVESAGGTTNGSATIAAYAPIVSENLIVVRNDLDSKNIMAQWDVERVYNGLIRIQGTVSTQLHPLTTGYFMRSAFDVTTVQPGNAAGQLAPFYCVSDAAVRAHTFLCGQTQFQAGSGSDVPTNTFEINRGPAMGIGSSFVYYNCAANTFKLSVQAGQIVMVDFDFLGRDFGGIAKTTPVFPPTAAFLWNQASLTIAGGASNVFERLDVELNNNLEAVPKLDGRNRPDLIKRNNFRMINVNGQLQFQTYSEYDRFLAGSETPMRIVLTGDGLPGGNFNRFVCDIPSMRYTGFPLNIAGPGRLNISFTGRGTYNQGSATAMVCTVVNTRINNYNTNSTA